MGALTNIKTKVVKKIQGLAEFKDHKDDVFPFRAIDPGATSEQVASKLSGLAAFVSIERLQKGSEDLDPEKNVTVIIDVWINPWNEKAHLITSDESYVTLRNGDPVMIQLRDAEDLIAAVIAGTEALETESWEDSSSCKQRLAFQDAFRVADAPKPFLVYRILTKTQTVLGNE